MGGPVNAACDKTVKQWETTIKPMLTQLNEKTACRHVLMMPKTHTTGDLYYLDLLYLELQL